MRADLVLRMEYLGILRVSILSHIAQKSSSKIHIDYPYMDLHSEKAGQVDNLLRSHTGREQSLPERSCRDALQIQLVLDR